MERLVEFLAVVTRKSVVHRFNRFAGSMRVTATTPAPIPIRLMIVCSNVNAGSDRPSIMIRLLACEGVPTRVNRTTNRSRLGGFEARASPRRPRTVCASLLQLDVRRLDDARV